MYNFQFNYKIEKIINVLINNYKNEKMKKLLNLNLNFIFFKYYKFINIFNKFKIYKFSFYYLYNYIIKFEKKSILLIKKLYFYLFLKFKIFYKYIIINLKKEFI